MACVGQDGGGSGKRGARRAQAHMESVSVGGGGQLAPKDYPPAVWLLRFLPASVNSDSPGAVQPRRSHACCSQARLARGTCSTRRGEWVDAPALCRRPRRSLQSQLVRRRIAARPPPCPPAAAAQSLASTQSQTAGAASAQTHLHFRDHEVVLLIVTRVRAQQQLLRAVVLARVLHTVLHNQLARVSERAAP